MQGLTKVLRKSKPGEKPPGARTTSGMFYQRLNAPLIKRKYGEPVVVMLYGTRDTPVKGVVSQVP